MAVVVLPEREQDMELRKDRPGMNAKVAREASVLEWDGGDILVQPLVKKTR